MNWEVGCAVFLRFLSHHSLLWRCVRLQGFLHAQKQAVMATAPWIKDFLVSGWGGQGSRGEGKQSECYNAVDQFWSEKPECTDSIQFGYHFFSGRHWEVLLFSTPQNHQGITFNKLLINTKLWDTGDVSGFCYSFPSAYYSYDSLI